MRVFVCDMKDARVHKNTFTYIDLNTPLAVVLIERTALLLVDNDLDQIWLS
jgi:hypothetical protein